MISFRATLVESRMKFNCNWWFSKVIRFESIASYFSANKNWQFSQNLLQMCPRTHGRTCLTVELVPDNGMSSNMKVIKINVGFAYLNKIRSCVYFIARILTWLYFPISAHFHLEEKRVEHWFSLKTILLSQKNLKRTSKENVWMQFLNKQHYFHAKGVVQRLVHVKTAVWPLV